MGVRLAGVGSVCPAKVVPKLGADLCRKSADKYGTRNTEANKYRYFREVGLLKEIVVECRRRRLRFNSSIISKIPAARTYAAYQVQGYGTTLNKSLKCVP